MSGLFAGTPLERPVTCEVCRKPLEDCSCPRNAEGTVRRPQDQTALIKREKRRKGKIVTTVSGLDPVAVDLPEIAAALKSRCGAGGTVDEGVLVIQGDHRDAVEADLVAQGLPGEGRPLSDRRLRLRWIDGGPWAVARLAAKAGIPAWAADVTDFVSATRSADELSVVAAERIVPADVEASRGWSMFRVDGTLDFALVGIISSLSTALARAGVSVFVMSTFDTDYVMVPSAQRDRAAQALADVADFI